jgi:O-antigen/teichoic acid export membrane protein
MVSRLLVQGLVWVVTLWVARLLDPFDYGLMTTGMIFVGLADLLAEAGVGRALIQKKDLHQDDLHCAFSLSLVLATGLVALLWGIAPLVATFFELPPLAEFLRVLALLVFTIPFRTIALALLDRELKMGRQAAVHVLSMVFQSATVLALALWGMGYWALAVGAFVSRILEAVLLGWAARWRPGLGWPRGEQLELVYFGMHVSLGTLLWALYSKADYAIVSKLVGATPLGWYALAFQLISIPVEKLTVNTNQVAYPVFCRLQDDRKRLHNWYLRLTVLLGFFGMPVLVGMALVAPDAFSLVLGERWAQAVLPFQLLSVVGIVRLYAASLPPLFNALGRPDVNLRYTAVCALVLPAGFYVGGSLAGLEGVCIAWLVLYPLIVAGLLVATRELTGLGLGEMLFAQRAVLGGVLFMTAVVLLVRWGLADLSWPWLRLGVSCAIGAASYAGFLLVFARHTVLADLRRLYRELRGD